MKKIYTFTFRCDKLYEDKFKQDLRLAAYMLYNEIYNYYGDNVPLDINNNIIYNKLHDHSCEHGYVFDSELSEQSSIYYEPFLVGNNSFGLTVIDDMISEDAIKNLMEYILKMLNLNYQVVINSFKYESLNIDDEKNRKKALINAFEKLNSKLEIRKGLLDFLTDRRKKR